MLLKPEMGLSLLFICSSCLILRRAEASKILFYFGFSTYSDRLAVWPYVEALVAKGHDITFLSPYPPREEDGLGHPRVQEILPSPLIEFMSTGYGDILEKRMDNNHDHLWQELREKGRQACATIFEDEKTLEMLNSTEFDLLIINSFNNECAYGLAYRYKAPFIVYGTSSVLLWQPDIYGFFPETSWIPDMTMKIAVPLIFLQRVHNTVHPIYWYIARHWKDYPEMDKTLRKAFRMKFPPLEELEKNASLVLQNIHYSTEFARTLPPLLVPVAGLHLLEPEKRQPIPKEIEAFINESNAEGFMYISFGSHLDMTAAPAAFLDIFCDVLGTFSIRFIWGNWDGIRPEKMPDNVLLHPWTPQQTLLAHPKMKGIICNGGLLSIQEAIVSGVPLIVLPVFGDQDYNSEKVERLGYGIRLEIYKLKREGLSDAISNLINEPIYAKKAQEMSKLFLDRPANALDTAMWWTDYVIRHRGAINLRPWAQNLNWFQRRTLDVYGFLTFIVFFLLIVIYLLLRQTCLIIFAVEEDEVEEGRKSPKRPRSPMFSSRGRYVKSKIN